MTIEKVTHWLVYISSKHITKCEITLYSCRYRTNPLFNRISHLEHISWCSDFVLQTMKGVLQFTKPSLTT